MRTSWLSNDFLSVGVSGMDSSEILVGCPSGGCDILYCKSLSPVILRIFTSSQRYLSLHNSLDDSPFAVLFVCVYFPTGYSSVASHTAFAECVGELDGIISAENFDNIVIVGDFNTDLSRPGSNLTTLSSFMNSHNLVCVDSYIILTLLILRMTFHVSPPQTTFSLIPTSLI